MCGDEVLVNNSSVVLMLQVCTDVAAVEAAILKYGDAVACVACTTSVFAPRAPDRYSSAPSLGSLSVSPLHYAHVMQCGGDSAVVSKVWCATYHQQRYKTCHI